MTAVNEEARTRSCNSGTGDDRNTHRYEGEVAVSTIVPGDAESVQSGLLESLEVDTPAWVAVESPWEFEPAGDAWHRTLRSEVDRSVGIYLAATQTAVMTSPPSSDFPEGTWQVRTEPPALDGELGVPFNDPGAAIAGLVSWAAWLLTDIAPIQTSDG